MPPSGGKDQNSFKRRKKSRLCVNIHVKNGVWKLHLICVSDSNENRSFCWKMEVHQTFCVQMCWWCLVAVDSLTFHWPHPGHYGLLCCCVDALWLSARSWFVRFLLLYFQKGFPGWGEKADVWGLCRHPSVCPSDACSGDSKMDWPSHKTSRWYNVCFLDERKIHFTTLAFS